MNTSSRRVGRKGRRTKRGRRERRRRRKDWFCSARKSYHSQHRRGKIVTKTCQTLPHAALGGTEKQRIEAPASESTIGHEDKVD